MELRKLIKQTLEEDIGSGDITSNATIPASHSSQAIIFAKDDGILCGINVAKEVFLAVDNNVKFKMLKKDGSVVRNKQVVAEISGKTKSILAAERTALNFLQHLSGIATTTKKFVDEMSAYKTKIYDTRKTTPGLRELEKYAVRCGSGFNHRQSLHDMILIKDNHIKAAGSIAKAVSQARKKHENIEVETKTLEEVKHALKARADIIMLDNMEPKEIAECIKAIGKRALVEISGNISLENIKEYAKLGANRISVGSALTLSAKAMDFSLKITN